MFSSVWSVIWLALGPIVLGVLVVVRNKLKAVGIETVDALLYPFLRRVRQSVSATVNFRRYCRISLADEKTANLSVPGARDSTALRTDSVFVKLHFDTVTNSRETYSNEDILSAGKRIRVVGEPGSGKSSLVKRVFRDLCRQGLTKPREARLPILIELKSLQPPRDAEGDEAKSRWLLDELRKRVAGIDGHDMGKFFDLSVSQNGIVVLLDGLDEVATESYERVAEAIQLLSRKLSELGAANSVLLTMRVQFHRRVQRDFDDCFPSTLHVKPFTPGDIYEFLTKWFAKTDLVHEAARIYNELAARPSLREMCTNPLILSMYTANYREMVDADFPDTRAEFYKSVIDELLVKRRSRQLEDRTGRVAKRNARYRIFGQLAFENMTDFDQATNSISWDRAVEVTRKVLQLRDNTAAVAALEELGEETGIFVEERTGETIRFLHLTFCEYLAAAEAIENRTDGWKQIIESHVSAKDLSRGATRMAEVIPFAYAMIQNVNRPAALDDVYGLDDRELYARCVLEMQDYDHATFARYLAEERKWLLSVGHRKWNEQWLSRLHLYQAVVADAGRIAAGDDMRTYSVDKLFTDLVDDKRERLLRLFSSYAAQSPSAAFKLAHACGVDLVKEIPGVLALQCQDPPFLSFCLGLADRQAEAKLHWARIFVKAAMSSAVAANLLARARAPKHWRADVVSGRRRHHWNPLPGKGLPSDSLYGASITAVVADLPSNDYAGPFGKVMSAIRNMKAPRSMAPQLLMSSVLTAAICYVVDVGLLLLLEKGSWAPNLWFVTIMFVLIYSNYALPYFMFRSHLYRVALNLDAYGSVCEVRLKRLILHFAVSISSIFNRPLRRAVSIQQSGGLPKG